MLRVRSEAGGPGQTWWKSAGQPTFPSDTQRLSFRLAPSADWQEITLDLPVTTPTEIIRVYLPASNGPVDIRTIEHTDRAGGKPVKSWHFE